MSESRAGCCFWWVAVAIGFLYIFIWLWFKMTGQKPEMES